MPKFLQKYLPVTNLIEDKNNIELPREIIKEKKAIDKKEQVEGKIGDNYKTTLAAIVGKNSGYYLEEFEKIEEGKSPRFNPMTLVSGIWMPYRKMNKEIYLTLIPIVGWIYGIYLFISNLFMGNKRYYNSILKKINNNGLRGTDIEVDKNIQDKVKALGGTSIGNVCLYVGINLLVGIIMFNIMIVNFIAFSINTSEASTVFKSEKEKAKYIQEEQQELGKIDYAKILEYPFPNSDQVFTYLDDSGVSYIDEYKEDEYMGIVHINSEGSIGSFEYEWTGKTILITQIDLELGSLFNGMVVGEDTIESMKKKLGEPEYEGTEMESGYYGLGYITDYGIVSIESKGFGASAKVSSISIQLTNEFGPNDMEDITEEVYEDNDLDMKELLSFRLENQVNDIFNFFEQNGIEYKYNTINELYFELKYNGKNTISGVYYNEKYFPKGKEVSKIELFDGCFDNISVGYTNEQELINYFNERRLLYKYNNKYDIASRDTISYYLISTDAGDVLYTIKNGVIYRILYATYDLSFND